MIKEKIRILDFLVWVEEFESFLDIKYPALFLETVLRKPLWQILYEFRGMAVTPSTSTSAI